MSNLQRAQQGAALSAITGFKCLNLPFCPGLMKLTSTHRVYKDTEAKKGLALAKWLSNTPFHNGIVLHQLFFVDKFLIPSQKVF